MTTRPSRALADISKSVRVGPPALLADVVEESPVAIDAAMANLGGTVLEAIRCRSMQQELAAAEEAQQEAKRKARKQLREARREARGSDRDEPGWPESEARAAQGAGRELVSWVDSGRIS